MMEEKAQVPLEWLLIALAGIALVTIVSIAIKSSANTAVETTKEQAEKIN
ncbi:MAG: hypothetical protein PHY04_00275 [Candidatus ainarchaeum sp.]|jgi:uncharacterized protein (UPF0333 family)|nr:hypothetical protein [Candidatus ainarchaeum sp.]MDD3085499.1 hypothetical protein [Candidatus ainarchaeum sp.]MDD4128158.1 hypothetical protein [Candidatus ainarchaeum sp.]